MSASGPKSQPPEDSTQSTTQDEDSLPRHSRLLDEGTLVLTHKASPCTNHPSDSYEFQCQISPSLASGAGFSAIPRDHLAAKSSGAQRYFLTRASWTLGKQETKELRHPDNMMRIFGVSQIDDPKGALEDLKNNSKVKALPVGLFVLPGLQCPKFPGVPLYFSTQVHLDDSASLQVTACYLHTSNPKLCPFNPGFESAGRFVHQIDLKLIQRRTALHQLGIPRGPIYQTKFVKNMIWDEAQDRVSIYELSGDNTRWVERTGGVDSLKLPGIKRKRSSVTDTGNVSSASLGHAGPSGTSGALAATRAPAGSRSSPRMESDASSIHPNVDNTMDPVSSPQSHDDDHEPVTKRAKLLREVKKETTDNLPASIADHVTPPPQTIDSMSSPHPQHDDHEPVTKRAKKHSEAKETTDNLPASIVDHVTPPPRQYIVLERIYPDSVPAPSAEAPPPGQSTSARTDVKGKMRAVERSSASLSSSTKPNAMSSRDTEIKYGDRSGYSGRWGKGEHPNTPTDFQVKGMLDKYHRREERIASSSKNKLREWAPGEEEEFAEDEQGTQLASSGESGDASGLKRVPKLEDEEWDKDDLLNDLQQ